ncbi:MAG: bifunctional hydroxymethylpyrimidine kinase/phosphomethylpyrimidine kinase [Gammaproteobacteria bacterium]|nr:bifunctional hydroxymethylpyrimidine kinase/phosphomethylpyrimidine kinase [Gammaproteobacteria bacterium]
MKKSSRAVVWTVAGSDCSGGAGLQADLKTFSHLGVAGCSVVTAITAQNSTTVSAIHPCSDEIFQQQIDTLAAEFFPSVIKSGMLASATQVEYLSQFLQRHRNIIYICDPVMVASAGTTLADSNVVEAMKKWLLPRANLLTPNRHEVAQLAQQPFDHINAATTLAAVLFRCYNPTALLLKGGDLSGNVSEDCYYHQDGQTFSLQQPRHSDQSLHGSGCTLAAAIAAFVAKGSSIEDAVVQGKCYISQAIAHSTITATGSLWLNHPDRFAITTLPTYYQPWKKFSNTAFKKLVRPIDFYPIVDRSDWLPRLAQAGVKTVQLRIKDRPMDEVAKEIAQAVVLARQHDIDLFINDYWQLAIKYGAYGIHLGQEDLDEADLGAIHHAGIRLGLSSHDYYELARAHSLQPSYIALGPIYPTTSKVMHFAPQGLDKISQWRQLIADTPLVAIGGIQYPQQMAAIISAGADAVSVISYITTAAEPLARADEAIKTIIEKKSSALLFQPRCSYGLI